MPSAGNQHCASCIGTLSFRTTTRLLPAFQRFWNQRNNLSERNGRTWREVKLRRLHASTYWAESSHAGMSCVVELPCLSKAVQNQIAQLFLLLPVVVFTMVLWTLMWAEMLFFCCSRYDVTDILSVTRHMMSHYVNSRISTLHRASLLFSLQLLFVREGRPLLSADDIGMFVDFMCISWCE